MVGGRGGSRSADEGEGGAEGRGEGYGGGREGSWGSKAKGAGVGRRRPACGFDTRRGGEDEPRVWLAACNHHSSAQPHRHSGPSPPLASLSHACRADTAVPSPTDRLVRWPLASPQPSQASKPARVEFRRPRPTESPSIAHHDLLPELLQHARHLYGDGRADVVLPGLRLPLPDHEAGASCRPLASGRRGASGRLTTTSLLRSLSEQSSSGRRSTTSSAPLSLGKTSTRRKVRSRRALLNLSSFLSPCLMAPLLSPMQQVRQPQGVLDAASDPER